VCTPYTNGKTTQQVDGNDGIDNAFGSSIMPQLAAVGNLSQTLSEKIISGGFTIELETAGLTATASQTNIGLGGQLFNGGTYPGTPPTTGAYFSATDSWPVTASSLVGGSLSNGAKMGFPEAYVTSGTWVSGTPITLGVALNFGGEPLPLMIHHAVITFTHTVDGSGQGHATNGIISGVLDTAEFISAFNLVVGQISGGAECSVVSAIEPTFYNAQDIILDPTSGQVSNTAGTPCNAISIGIAFDADEILDPSTIAAPTDAGVLLPACPG